MADPMTVCSSCGLAKSRDSYSKSQLRPGRSRRRCVACVAAHLDLNGVLASKRRRRVLLLDLENLAFLAHNLQPFSMACVRRGVEFHSYASWDHAHANRVTDVVHSSEKEAVDVKMVWDASRYVRSNYLVLIVTKDQFGRTLASLSPENVEHVTWDAPLPTFYAERVFGAESLKELGETYGIFETHEERSVAGSVTSSRRSWLRPLTAATFVSAGPAWSTSWGLGAAQLQTRSRVLAEEDEESVETESPDTEFGYISFYDPDKGFGFIRPQRRGAHVFLHGSCFQGGLEAAAALRRKQRVSFVRRPSRKYPGKFNASVADVC